MAVASVKLLNAPGGAKSVTPAEFLALPISERTSLILKKQVEFYDAAGGLMNTLDAVKTLSAS